jgi:Tfp pilus assembly protein PilN
MIKVNLVPQEILDKEIQRHRMMQVGVVAAIIGVMLIGVSFSHYRHKTAVIAQLEEENKTLKHFQDIVDKVNAFEAKAAAVRARLNVMNDLIKSRELYPIFMVDIIESFPDGV